MGCAIALGARECAFGARKSVVPPLRSVVAAAVVAACHRRSADLGRRPHAPVISVVPAAGCRREGWPISRGVLSGGLDIQTVRCRAMSARIATDLPIEPLIPEILGALAAAPNLVLEAPPGAVKTTRVPLALLDANWAKESKIIVLEPRRLAARGAAARMAAMLGEEVGETVGYRVRLDRKVGAKTRIEVVTTGLFLRQLQGDPALPGVAAILFDEFHERTIEG